MTETRSPNFRRNESLESLLRQLEDDLRPAECRLVDIYQTRDMAWPVLLVMGPLRSGTTLFMQWLASSGKFAYPTNLLSRFYMAPILGAKLQLLLTDPRFQFRHEFDEFTGAIDFRSENGKTAGILAPNEFWYFWRRFLSDRQRDVWTDEELYQHMDIGSLRADLTGMTEVFGKPFIAKAMLFNYNIPFLAQALDKAIFVRIRREPVANCISALEARQRQFGDTSRWYSFQIPESSELAHLEPIEQVAGQIFHIERGISRGFEAIPPERRLEVSYEDFCRAPGAVYRRLADLLAPHGINLGPYAGPPCFEISNRSSHPDEARFRAALEQLARRHFD